MVGKILAHVDYLEEFIGELSAEVERVIAPFSEKVERLGTIPGVERRTAEALIAEIGVDTEIGSPPTSILRRGRACVPATKSRRANVVARARPVRARSGYVAH